MRYTERMLKPSVIEYLTQAKEAGTPIDVVAAELVKNGWGPDILKEAQAWYTGTPLTPQAPKATMADSMSQYMSAPPTPATQPIQQTKHNYWGIIPAIIALCLIILTGTTGTYAYFLAADKISSENQFIENSADAIALNVPFFPKTPKIVLNRAIISDRAVTKASLDFSLVATSNDFGAMLGANELDIQIKGYTDLDDPKNPKISLSGNITKDFSFEIRKKDPILYFKITKLPALLTSMMGLDQATLQPLVDTWVAYDTTPLNTEARKSLDELSADSEKKSDSVGAFAEKLLSEDILPALTMKEESMEGFATYKIVFQPSDSLLNKLGGDLEKEFSSSQQYKQVLGASTFNTVRAPLLSDTVKNFSIILWVDSKNYYIRKMSLSMDVHSTTADGANYPNQLPLPTIPTSPTTLVAVLKLSDFGEALEIDTPLSSMSMDQFYEKIGEIMYGAMSKPELQQGY
ncbi:hypothetical protein KA078_01670 [Candidatus Woesebacteria bacterium]|nr:hypothetical protein [Candidatus Woesebacteria bacterium]